MVDEILAYLRSFVRDQELSTHLTVEAADHDYTLTVDDASTLSRGRIQIDDEIIWIDRADREGKTATVPPYGRGMDGTTKALHTAGTRVIVQPLYPRKMVKDVINQSIMTVGGQLYGVTEVVLTSSTSFMYDLPATTRDVLSVQVTDPRASGDVTYLRDWQFDKKAPSTISATGKALYLFDGMLRAPETLVVTCSVNPILLVDDGDLFTDTLMQETAFDVVVLLTSSRLLATAESYNLQTRAIEANAMDSRVQPGQGVSQSKYLFALYQQRLDEERTRLLNSTANRSHYSR
jgi:hypothetical protein